MSITIYQQCTAFAILIVLIIATYFDCKNSVIPLYLFPILITIITPLSVIYGQPLIMDSVIGMLIGTGSFLALAVFFKGGGADILMMGTLGWFLGVRGIIILIIISSGVYALIATGIIIYSAFIKKKEFCTSNSRLPRSCWLAISLACCLDGWFERSFVWKKV
ncbi:MAG: hypothetical protein LBI03_02045 [Clostridiales bacterium]|jgi:hypothetical protein|nr:hypothetical protein [Clostridiales bacterium]